MRMFIRNIKPIFFISLVITLSSFVNSNVMADKHSSVDISEFHKILDAINQSNIPEDVKNQLFRDMRTTLIENVRQANIPESTKQTIIRELESSSR